MSKISYYDYVKKSDISVIIAEIIFKSLKLNHKCVVLSDVVETSSGGTPNRSNPQYYNGNIPWLKSGELNDGYINISEEFITEEGLKNSSAKVFPEKTLLVAMYGATAGKTAILNIAAATNQAICAVFPKNNSILNEYLYWFFRSHRYYFIDISRGGAQPNISQTKINETLIPIIDTTYQNKIFVFLKTIENDKHVDYSLIPKELHFPIKKAYAHLSCLQNLMGENSAQSDYLTLLRQSILQEAIEGKLTADWRKQNPVKKGDPEYDAAALFEKIKAEKQKLIAEGKIKKEKQLAPIKPEEMPFELPGGWVWTRLGKVIIYADNLDIHKKLSSNTAINYIDIDSIDNKLHQIREIKQKKVSELSSRARRILKKGYIIYSTVRPYLENVAIIDEDRENYIGSTGFNVFKPVSFDSKYMFNYLLTPSINNQYKEIMAGFNSPSITNEQFENTLFALPSITEQRAIIERIDQLLAMVDELEKQVSGRKVQAEELMQAVLREAFEG